MSNKIQILPALYPSLERLSATEKGLPNLVILKLIITVLYLAG